MMAEYYFLARGNVIHSVFKPHRRRDVAVVDRENPPADEATVQPVHQQVAGKGEKHDQECVHGYANGWGRGSKKSNIQIPDESCRASFVYDLSKFFITFRLSQKRSGS
jgi:hypothetical protein